MRIAEKYEKGISYLYPIAQGLPRAHGVARNMFLESLLGQAELREGSYKRGINFLGYRIWPSHKLLRKDSVTRAKRKVANFIEHGEDEGLQKFLASWSGYAMWADANNLFT